MWGVLVYAALWTTVLYALTFVVVRRHYAASLPHFDSMGGFSGIWHIMNVTEAEGYAVALTDLLYLSTGWVQPLFAILMAGWPVRSPEAVVALNFVLLLLTQVAIVNLGRAYGFSAGRQIVMIGLPLLPAVMSGWNGGIQDMRRDTQLIILLTGALMQSLAYAERPSLANGAFLGLLGGLTLWSRDNSAFPLAISMLPAAVMTVRRGHAAAGLQGVVRRATVPSGVFLAMLAPYYLSTLGLTWERYTTNVWGFGRDRVTALLTTWDTLLQIVVGGRFAGTTPAGAGIALAALATLAVVLAVCWRRGQISLQPRRLCARPYVLLLVSGVTVGVGLWLFYAVGVGVLAHRVGIAYLPLTAPVVVTLVALLGMVARTPATTTRTARMLPFAASMLVLITVVVRMAANNPPPYGEENVAAFRGLTLELSRLAGGRPVAILWTEDFSRHHMAYYLAQAGHPPVVDFATRATSRGFRIDLDQPLRPGDRPDVLRQRLDVALRTYAEMVVVCLEPGAYENSVVTPLWPYIVGQPVIARLLADPSFVLIEQFTVNGRPFAILKNREFSLDAPLPPQSAQ